MGQPARSKEQKSCRYLQTQFSQIAGLRTCYNAGGAPIDDSDTPKPTFAISCALTLTPTQTLVPTLAFAFASILGPLRRYRDKNLQKATKLALELFVKGQEYG